MTAEVGVGIDRLTRSAGCVRRLGCRRVAAGGRRDEGGDAEQAEERGEEELDEQESGGHLDRGLRGLLG